MSGEDDRDKRIQVARKVGENSVADVCDALEKHPELFRSFYRTEKGGRLDLEGRDIVVEPVNTTYYLKWFSIEVKSGDTGVFEFLGGAGWRARGDRVSALGMARATIERLFEYRQIVVMGRDELQIEMGLLKQFEALREFWRLRSEGQSTDEMLWGLLLDFFGMTEEMLQKEIQKVVERQKTKDHNC